MSRVTKSLLVLNLFALGVLAAPSDVTHTHAFNCRTQALEPLKPFDIDIARGNYHAPQNSSHLLARDISLGDACTASMSTLPQFHDLPEEILMLMRTENNTGAGIPDEEYFDFSPANLAESETHLWYAGFTIVAQKLPKWAELGETKLFARIFGRSVNFECGPSYKTCVEKPSLSQLQLTYPGDELRPLVRRIHFQLHMFEINRQVLNARLEREAAVHTLMDTDVPEIVRAFTKQIDGQKNFICDLIHIIITQLINTSVSLAMMGFNSLLDDALSPEGPLAKLVLTQASRRTLEASSNLNQATESLLQHMKGNSAWGFGLNAGDHNFQLVSYMISQMPPLIQSHSETAWAEAKAGKLQSTGGPRINGGISHGHVCAWFEGDQENHNPENIEQLRTYLGRQFVDLRKASQQSATNLYHGLVLEEGQPSQQAVLFWSYDWHGKENGILYELNNPVVFDVKSFKNIMIRTISGVLGDGQNYAMCTHDSSAPKKCSDASSKPDDEYSQSLWCPEPTTDPTLICQLSGWYTADFDSHQRSMVGLSNLPTFHKGEYDSDLAGFKTQVWENYKRWRNFYSESNWALEQFGVAGTEGFFLPTCFSEDHVPFERFVRYKGEMGYGVTGNSYHFPSTCGDYRGNETGVFQRLLALGSGSKLYLEKGPTNDLYKDRIPRNLQHVKPVNGYLGECHSGIRFPWRGAKGWNATHYSLGFDDACELVYDRTEGMSEWEGNKWFCSLEGGDEHGVFGREKEGDHHAEINALPPRAVSNHKFRCQKWMEVNKIEVPKGWKEKWGKAKTEGKGKGKGKGPVVEENDRE